MNTPRIWYLPFSTFSLTTKSWKLKKTWKCCLPFFFKKMQRHLWLSEWLPSLDLLHGRALHCSLKQLLRERSSKRRHPVSEGRTSGVSLPKVVDYTPQPPGGEVGTRSIHGSPKALHGIAASCNAYRVSPHRLHGQPRYPNWSCEGQTWKAGARPHAAKTKAALLPSFCYSF